MQTKYETKQAAYEAEIEPLVLQIFDLCEKHKINQFSLFQLDDEGESTSFAVQRMIDQENKKRVAPEIIACAMIANEGSALAAGIVKAIAERRRSAEENPHGIAD